MDAFGTNTIIKAIHAPDKDLKELREAVEEKVLADMRDQKTTVLVVRYSDDESASVRPTKLFEDGVERGVSSTQDVVESVIVGFAKWTHPVQPNENYKWPRWNLSKTKDRKVLDPWLAEVKRVEEEIIGDTPRYGQYLLYR
jgi:hypothetical protein